LAVLLRESEPAGLRRPFASELLKPIGGKSDTTGMSVTIPQAEILARLMDVAQLRHQVISQNLANVNTPGYQQLDVSFEETFARALGKGGEAGALKVTPRVVPGQGNPARQDGNTVDLDKEVGSLNKNSMLFSMATQMLTTRLNMMRSAIAGR
jgi:flagellar basal-body rod protein FlgB